MKTNIMKTIEIDGKSYLIDLEKATEQGLLKEKDKKPHSWEEFMNTRFPMQCSHGNREDIVLSTALSQEEAKALKALNKLIILRDAWWGEWEPDWNNDENKYCIYSFNSGMRISDTCYSPFFLAFPTKEMATDFLKTFRDLIEEAKMFL